MYDELVEGTHHVSHGSFIGDPYEQRHNEGVSSQSD